MIMKVYSNGIKNILLLSLTFIFSLTASSQKADSLAAVYLNDNRWFELQDLYKTDSTSISPFLRLFSRAMLHHVFNKPQEATDDIIGLIRGYQNEMGSSTTFSMMLMLIRDYADAGNYAKAATSAKTFADQLEGKVNYEIITEFQQSLYEELAKQELYQIHDSKSHEIRYKWTKVGESEDSLIHIVGSVNGRKDQFVFDTGAGYNVITPKLAEKYGLRILKSTVATKGTKLGTGNIAIADSIRVGDIIMRNVPFAVLDLNAGNERIGSATSTFSLILGQPFLQQFGRYTIDTERQTITFEQEIEEKETRHNIYRMSTLYMEVEHSNKHFAINFDTGASRSTFGYAYYKDFTPEINREGRWDIEGMAGYGGISYESIFRMPKITLGIGNKQCNLEDTEVAALPSQNGLTDGYGRLGLDFLRQWQKIVVDNKNMTIRVY